MKHSCPQGELHRCYRHPRWLIVRKRYSELWFLRAPGGKYAGTFGTQQQALQGLAEIARKQPWRVFG